MFQTITELNKEFELITSGREWKKTITAWGQENPQVQEALTAPSPSHEQMDELIKFLICKHQNGQYLAGRLILQALIPFILKTVHNKPSPEDHIQEAIADVWEKIETIDPNRVSGLDYGTRMFLHQRATDMKRTRDQKTARNEPIMDLLAPDQMPQIETEENDQTLEVLRLLLAMLNNGVIEKEETALLTKTIFEGKTSKDLAHETGYSAASIRQKNHRTIKKIKAAIIPDPA